MLYTRKVEMEWGRMSLSDTSYHPTVMRKETRQGVKKGGNSSQKSEKQLMRVREGEMPSAGRKGETLRGSEGLVKGVMGRAGCPEQLLDVAWPHYTRLVAISR